MTTEQRNYDCESPAPLAKQPTEEATAPTSTPGRAGRRGMRISATLVSGSDLIALIIALINALPVPDEGFADDVRSLEQTIRGLADVLN